MRLDVTRLVPLAACIALLSAAGASIGCGSSDGGDPPATTRSEQPTLSAAEQAQADWDARTGTDWEDFVSGYEVGYTIGCDQLFDLSSDGSVVAGEEKLTNDDCPVSDDPEKDGVDIPSEVPASPQRRGRKLGVSAGCAAIFKEEKVDTVQADGQALTAADCRAGKKKAEPVEQQESGCGDASYQDYAGDYGGNTWGTYSGEKREAVACLFVANNPGDCAGVDSADLAQTVYDGYGADFPLATSIKDALLQVCRSKSGSASGPPENPSGIDPDPSDDVDPTDPKDCPDTGPLPPERRAACGID